MELFDELVECDVGIVVPHLSALIHFCLEVASTATLGNNIRVKALSFVSWLITLKKKVWNGRIFVARMPVSFPDLFHQKERAWSLTLGYLINQLTFELSFPFLVTGVWVWIWPPFHGSAEAPYYYSWKFLHRIANWPSISFIIIRREWLYACHLNLPNSQLDNIRLVQKDLLQFI